VEDGLGLKTGFPGYLVQLICEKELLVTETINQIIAKKTIVEYFIMHLLLHDGEIKWKIFVSC
jgi:hypothetical protein